MLLSPDILGARKPTQITELDQELLLKPLAFSYARIFDSAPHIHIMSGLIVLLIFI